MKLVNIGFGNVVAAGLSAVQPETVAARAEPDTDMEEDEEDE